MSSEKFSLKWNDFATNVSNSFSRLRQETRLYDVTLVSNDHQQVSAHKLVLSACSEVFSYIFNSNNGSLCHLCFCSLIQHMRGWQQTLVGGIGIVMCNAVFGWNGKLLCSKD